MAINWRMELRNQRIVEMWRQNKTSSEIAKEIGITRSAVMGVVCRHGERKTKSTKKIGPPFTATKIIEVPNIYNPRKNVRKRIKVRLTKPEKYFGVSEPFKEMTHVQTKGKKLMQLGPFDCRWIFEDNSYCAKPKTFRSYCQHHAGIVYVPLLKKDKKTV